MNTENTKKFADFVILDEIGTGGMAQVYRARPANPDANGRVVVLKRLLPQYAENPIFIRMFRSETRIALGLNHPNVIQLYDFGEKDHQAYLVLEYVEGRNLKQIQIQCEERGTRVAVPLAIYAAEQAARGLHYLHTFPNPATGERSGLIHRDVTPHNILVGFHGGVKVIDFGIAKSNDPQADVTQGGVIKGKVGYLSPEQIASEKLDHRCDVFSLGIVLWELVTGQRLFNGVGRGDFSVMQMILNCKEVVRLPSEVNPSLPLALDEILMKALHRDREKRYATMSEFEKALRAFLNTFYPGYGGDDASRALLELFRSELETDRSKLRDLNTAAQQEITSSYKAAA